MYIQNINKFLINLMWEIICKLSPINIAGRLKLSPLVDLAKGDNLLFIVEFNKKKYNLYTDKNKLKLYFKSYHIYCLFAECKNMISFSYYCWSCLSLVGIKGKIM